MHIISIKFKFTQAVVNFSNTNLSCFKIVLIIISSIL